MSGQKKGKEAVLFPGERLDDLQLNGLELIQDPKKFCFGVDAVFLSDFVKIKAGERALDLGTGNIRRQRQLHAPARHPDQGNSKIGRAHV